MDKPVLVGMNNPYGTGPKYALYPWPEKSAGGRLYDMLAEAYERRFGCDFPGKRRGYVNGFDRYNVLSAQKWSAAEARKAGIAVRYLLGGRRVVILGRQTAKALDLPANPWFSKHRAVSYPGTEFDYWTIPHPSGMCREYNDPATRARAGDLLHALLQGWEPAP